MTTKQKLYISLIKRPVGVIVAFVALVLLSPLFFVTTALLFFANKNGFKGVFFTQDRPGRNAKLFKAIKFKTMTDERDDDGNLLCDALRLTKIGRVVRSMSIDELPQLINILKGDMAFIGPRPLLVKYLPLYSREQMRRHEVRPGISGWAQVNGRNNISFTKQFEYDVYYVDNLSLSLDVKIFLLTIIKVFKREGVNADGQATREMFTGKN